MADIIIKQPKEIRQGFSVVGDSQSGYKQIRGVGAFNGTDASGTLIVPGLNKVEHVELVALDVPKALTKSIHLTLGSISATTGHTCVVPAAGSVTAGIFATKDSIAQSNTDYWRFGIQNKGAAGAGSTYLLDPTVSASGTELAGGFALSAYVAKTLPLTAVANNLVVVAGDVLEVTFTKFVSAGNMTESSLRIDVNVGGTDETLYVTANSDGTIPISAGKITINRTGNLKTSGLKFSFTVTGK